jgi:hypothetical protein
VPEYRRWIKPRLTSFLDRIRPRAVALIPDFIANVIALAYCAILANRSDPDRNDEQLVHVANWFNVKPRS